MFTTKNTKPSEKEPYVKPEIEVVMFDISDVITTSGFEGPPDEFF